MLSTDNIEYTLHPPLDIGHENNANGVSGDI